MNHAVAITQASRRSAARRAAALAGALAMLSGCGGDGGSSAIPIVGGSPTPSPTATPTPAPTPAPTPTPSPTAAARTEVPIEQVALSDGTTRYAIRITVGGTSVLAGLDTGSSGLRLLPAAQIGLGSPGRNAQNTFGSGVVLNGPVAPGQIAIGTRADTIGVQQVTSVGCTSAKPDCNATADVNQYRVMGDGLPGEGFLAIIGIRPFPDSIPRNPLVQLRVHRWIVSLPQPGSATPGTLVLDPSDREVAGFTPVPSGSEPGQVEACLYSPGIAASPACGDTVLDTGAPGVGVFNAGFPDTVPAATRARLVFGARGATAPTLLLLLNDRAQMTRYSATASDGVTATQIRMGVTPYLAYDVLYDADRGTIAVRARAAYNGGPVARP